MVSAIERRSLFIGFGLFLVLTLMPTLSLAAEFKTSEHTFVSEGETITDDVYIAGDDVDMLGTVTGDLFAAGRNVFLQGTVGGDVSLAGGTITVLSTIADDVRIAGGEVVVRGSIGSDVIVFGGQIRLAGENIGGDVLATGKDIRIETPIGGDVRLWGETVLINAPITGRVEIDAKKIVLGEKAVLSGSFKYRSPQEAVQEPGSQVLGGVDYTEERQGKGVTREGVLAFVSLWIAGKFLMILAGALLLGLMFKRYLTEMARVAFARPWREMARGLLVVIVLPVVCVILLLSVIGLPLGIAGFLAGILLFILTSFLSPILVGTWLHARVYKPADYEVSWKTILVGTALFVLTTSIPVIGWIFCLVLMLLSLGALIHLKWRIAQEWR